MDAILKKFPRYVWICLAAVLGVQTVCYIFTEPFLDTSALHHLETAWDYQIPFRPEWVLVYLLCMPWWFVGGLLILADDKTYGIRFTLAYILALIVSAVVFLVYPGTLTRPELTGDGFFMDIMRLVYGIDTPTNLCPSLHVMLSYYIWRGTLDSRKLPRWYKWFCFIFLVLVCFSILYVKQHALIDIPSALLIGEAALQIANLTKPERFFLRNEPQNE
ncbi:MAG: hypothetical protein II783_09480 [Erysipelotrichales bacterium]|nr:hypothetical protein [Erysipelotrichales bacterium]